MSYMWCRCRGALRAAFRCSALRTTRRPEVCRYRDHRGEIRVMKTVIYRGGVACFRIPRRDWVEEYEEVRGGTFYKPGDNTGGTLCLMVISTVAPPGRSHVRHFERTGPQSTLPSKITSPQS